MPHTGDYRIEATGAAGGYDLHPNSAQYRGRGARMIGTFSLIKDEIIRILVGQEGGSKDNDWSSGGGGGTFVVRQNNTPLIIAGGGGGLCYLIKRHAGCDASTNTTGNPGYRSAGSGGIGGLGGQSGNASYAGEGISGGLASWRAKQARKRSAGENLQTSRHLAPPTPRLSENFLESQRCTCLSSSIYESLLVGYGNTTTRMNKKIRFLLMEIDIRIVKFREEFSPTKRFV